MWSSSAPGLIQGARFPPVLLFSECYPVPATPLPMETVFTIGKFSESDMSLDLLKSLCMKEWLFV